MILNILLALALQVPAAPDIPVGVVYMPRLIAESTVGKAATAQLKALQSEKQKVLSDKQAEVQKLATSKALAQLERARVELQRLTQDAQADLEALDRRLQEDLSKRLRPVVAEVAAENHIGIVFEYPHDSIVWVTPSVDITSKVIERLDAALKEKK